jgi:hypothetical protein
VADQFFLQVGRVASSKYEKGKEFGTMINLDVTSQRLSKCRGFFRRAWSHEDAAGATFTVLRGHGKWQIERTVVRDLLVVFDLSDSALNFGVTSTGQIW